VISVLLGLTMLCGCEVQGTEDHGAFEALAGVVVHLDDQQGNLVSLLQGYAEENHFRIVVKDLLPRKGRKVLQVQMYLSDRSHFYGDNFLDATKFSMHAYSHEQGSVWRNKWQRLIEKLKETFGSESVELSDPAPPK